MGLDYEYGINTGNRFLDLVDHDEDPEEFVAKQSQPEDKSKKSTKDSKTATSATTRKTSAKTTTTTTTTGSATSATANAARTNKENFTGKPTTNVQRGPQSNVLSDNVNQQTRVDSGRGGGRGFSRRGTGQDRPAYEGSGRGSGPHRSQRFQRFEGQHGSQEGRSFEQTGEAGEGGNNNQRFGGYQGRGGRGGDRGRGPRGTFYNRNFEGGRGRGRGGRGYFNNRNADDSSQQQQQQQPQTQDISQWQPNTDSTFENTSAEPAKTSGEALDADQPAQDRSLEPDGARRGGRGHFRARTFRNNRNFDQDRQYSHDQEGGQEDYRRNRRQHDRQPRSYTSGVKPVEKKDGEGAHNWGNAAEIPDEEQTAAAEDSNEAADQAASAPKNWADQVDEAEKKQLTLDEYKKQIEEKKRTQQEKFPQFNPRAAGEGEDPKNWQFKHEYRKKNDHEESGEEGEEGSGAEEEEDEDEDEHVSGKKRVITIPLHFNPTELPRGGSFGPRGGPRRGGRYRDRPFRDDQQRSKSPNQQQSPTSQPTDENRFDDQQQKPYRGGARQGPGRADYRRSYGNSARGSRGGYNRSHANPNTPDFDNTLDFPTLPKQ